MEKPQKTINVKGHNLSLSWYMIYFNDCGYTKYKSLSAVKKYIEKYGKIVGKVTAVYIGFIYNQNDFPIKKLVREIQIY